MTGTPSVSSLRLVCRLVTAACLAAFAVRDAKSHLIRNRSLLWFLPWCLACVLAKACEGASPAAALLSSAGGFLAGGLPLLVVSAATDDGIGGGDIKLTALLGMIAGPCGILDLLILSCMTALVHLFAVKIRLGKWPTSIPFAPYLAAAWLLQTALAYL